MPTVPTVWIQPSWEGREGGERGEVFPLWMGNLVADTEPNLLEPLFFAKLLSRRPFPPLLTFRKLESLP